MDGNQDVIIFQLLTAISSIGMDANTFVFMIKTLVTAITYSFVYVTRAVGSSENPGVPVVMWWA